MDKRTTDLFAKLDAKYIEIAEQVVIRNLKEKGLPDFKPEDASRNQNESVENTSRT